MRLVIKRIMRSISGYSKQRIILPKSSEIIMGEKMLRERIREDNKRRLRESIGRVWPFEEIEK